jgi:6-phosphogluconolactonase
MFALTMGIGYASLCNTRGRRHAAIGCRGPSLRRQGRGCRCDRREILDQANAAIAKRGRFRLVLAGGTTPTAAYRLLRDRDADWAAWHLYHGDERCLAVGDPERNSLVADEAWLHHVPVPRTQVHPIPAELGAEPAAEAYAAVVAEALPFDLVLLGIGEDGHTASLFPGRSIVLIDREAAEALG